MNKDQYENLPKFSLGDLTLDIADLDDQSDRTLFYGWSNGTSGNASTSVHVYIEDHKLHSLHYGFLENVVDYRVSNELSVETMIPKKRLYPRACDEEACTLLINKGAHLPFTNFEYSDDDQQFYGKRLQDLKQPPEHMVVLFEVKDKLTSSLRNAMIIVDGHELKKDDEDFFNRISSHLYSIYNAANKNLQFDPKSIEVFYELTHELYYCALNNETDGPEIAKNIDIYCAAALTAGIALKKYAI